MNCVVEDRVLKYLYYKKLQAQTRSREARVQNEVLVNSAPPGRYMATAKAVHCNFLNSKRWSRRRLITVAQAVGLGDFFKNAVGKMVTSPLILIGIERVSYPRNHKRIIYNIQLELAQYHF